MKILFLHIVIFFLVIACSNDSNLNNRFEYHHPFIFDTQTGNTFQLGKGKSFLYSEIAETGTLLEAFLHAFPTYSHQSREDVLKGLHTKWFKNLTREEFEKKFTKEILGKEEFKKRLSKSGWPPESNLQEN